MSQSQRVSACRSCALPSQTHTPVPWRSVMSSKLDRLGIRDMATLLRSLAGGLQLMHFACSHARWILAIPAPRCITPSEHMHDVICPDPLICERPVCRIVGMIAGSASTHIRMHTSFFLFLSDRATYLPDSERPTGPPESEWQTTSDAMAGRACLPPQRPPIPNAHPCPVCYVNRKRVLNLQDDATKAPR